MSQSVALFICQCVYYTVYTVRVYTRFILCLPIQLAGVIYLNADVNSSELYDSIERGYSNNNKYSIIILHMVRVSRHRDNCSTIRSVVFSWIIAGSDCEKWNPLLIEINTHLVRDVLHELFGAFFCRCLNWWWNRLTRWTISSFHLTEGKKQQCINK